MQSPLFLPIKQRCGWVLEVLRLLFQCKSRMLDGRVKEELDVKETHLELEKAPLRLDILALTLDISEDLLDKSEILLMLFVFFEHGLPKSEFEEWMDVARQHL